MNSDIILWIALLYLLKCSCNISNTGVGMLCGADRNAIPRLRMRKQPYQAAVTLAAIRAAAETDFLLIPR